MENLMEGRIDLAVMDRRVGRYLIRQHHLGKKDQVTFMEPPLAVRPLFLAISKNTPDPEKMISAFNRALSSMAEDGVLKRIRESHGIER
jgi:polar amino acid transport system substrate-binding protein